MEQKDNKYIILFLVLTFSISWSIWFFSGVLSKQYVFSYNNTWLTAQVGVFAPSISAILVSAVKERKICLGHTVYFLLIIAALLNGWIIKNYEADSVREIGDDNAMVLISSAVLTVITVHMLNLNYYGRNGKSKFVIKWLWLLLSIIILPLLFLISWIIANYGNNYLAYGLENGWYGFIFLVFSAFSMNLLLGGSLGEELGWRGFLLPQLIGKYNPVSASLILGIVWAFWHLPVDLFVDNNLGIFNFIFRIIWTIPLSIIFTWFFVKTEGSLLIALLLHTSINLIPDLGFSNYDRAIVLMTFILYPISITAAYNMRKSIIQ